MLSPTFRTPFAFLAGATIVLAGTAFAQRMNALRFHDVPEGAYFSESVDVLGGIGVLRGYDDGRFGPGDFITRAQVAVMIHRYDQFVVEPLREQIREIQLHLGIAVCGDHAIGETFAAPDGCNTCTCTESGISCTKRLCPSPNLCTSDAGCQDGLVCSTRYGDCRSMCPPGALCPAVCAGECVPPRGEGGMSCEDTRSQFSKLAEASENTRCTFTSDCRIFESSCPYVTCGEAVNAQGYGVLAEYAEKVNNACSRDGAVSCAACVQVDAFCVQGKCMKQEKRY